MIYYLELFAIYQVALKIQIGQPIVSVILSSLKGTKSTFHRADSNKSCITNEISTINFDDGCVRLSQQWGSEALLPECLFVV